MVVTVIDGMEQYTFEEIETVQVLKDKLNGKVKDIQFSLETVKEEYNQLITEYTQADNNSHNTNLEHENNLNLKKEMNYTFKILYNKKYCDLKECKLKRCRISGECRFCTFSFCATHKMPEEHSCTNLNQCKQEANQKNATQLENGKVQRSKI